MRTLLRAGLVAIGLAALGGCYVAETAQLSADTSTAVPGALDGRYCHAETKLVPPVLAVTPQISDSLGANKCRDLYWHADEARYVDRLSPGMVFRTADIGLPELYLLQVQTSEAAKARYAPLAVVEGLFVMFDPAGEWPADLVAAGGLDLDGEGILRAAEPEALDRLLRQVVERSITRFREDIAYVEDKNGPRLEFRAVAAAYSYIVYFKEDWAGDAVRMKAAMLALADRLSLGKYDRVWTRDVK